MKPQEEMILNSEQVENNPAKMGVSEDPFAKGRERMAAMSSGLNKAKEKASAWFDRAGGSISRFWGKTRHAAGEAVAATLSVDDLAKKGYENTSNALKAADEAVTEKVFEAGQYLGYKGAQAADYVGEKVTQGAEYVVTKTGEAGEWIADTQDKFAKNAEKAFEAAANFTEKKADQIAKFATDKAELTAALATYAADKTVEGLTYVRDGVANRYHEVKNYGENAWKSAQLRIAKIKEDYRNKQNEKRMARLEAARQAEIAHLAAQVEMAAQSEEMAKQAAEQQIQAAEQHGQIKNALMAKLNLMTSLDRMAA